MHGASAAPACAQRFWGSSFTPPNTHSATRGRSPQRPESWRRSNIHKRQDAFEDLHRILARRRTVLVRDVAGVAELDDRLGDEAVVELLRVVELMATRDAGGV